MTGGHHELRLGISYLSLLHTPIKNPLFLERQCPCTTASAATVIGLAIWVHLNKIFAALFQNPPGLLKITMSKGFQGFSSIVTGVMVGGKLRMDRFVYFNAAFFQVGDQDIKNSHHFEVSQIVFVPFFQPVPGGIVGMPSLRKDQRLAPQPIHVVNDAAHHDSHSFIITGKEPPVDTFPVFAGYCP